MTVTTDHPLQLQHPALPILRPHHVYGASRTSGIMQLHVAPSVVDVTESSFIDPQGAASCTRGSADQGVGIYCNTNLDVIYIYIYIYITRNTRIHHERCSVE